MVFYRNQINRRHHYLGALFWGLACAHNLDVWNIIYSLCFSPLPIFFPLFHSLLPVLVYLLTLPYCFLFFGTSPNLPCLIDWDDQNLNNQCWHFWVPSLGVRLNPLGGTEPWELTACRALSLVVCMFSTTGLTICSVFEVFFVILWLI